MNTATRWCAGLLAGVVAIVSFGLTSQNAAARVAEPASAVIGEKAPDFTLEDLDGEEITLSEFIEDGKVVVLEWWNPKCPFVVKHHDGMTTMKDLAEHFEDDVVWLKINSTNTSHRDYGHDREYARAWNIEEMTILADTDGEVGKMYGATKTPHMYIIDADGMLRYNGAIDNHPKASKPSKNEMEGYVNYVKQALEQIIAGETVTRPETRAYGCSVKYAK